MPVMARPRMRAWTSWVPSYVLTASRFMACRITWYSSQMPLPPIMSRAVRAISKAFPLEFRFKMEIISGATFPSSFKRPTWKIHNEIYTLSEAWSGVNWADLMAAQGDFGTDFYDRCILRPKHRAYYRSGRPVIKICPKGALGSHEIRPIHSVPSLGQSI